MIVSKAGERARRRDRTYWPDVARTASYPRITRFPVSLILLIWVKYRLKAFFGAVNASAVEVALRHDESHKSLCVGRLAQRDHGIRALRHLPATFPTYPHSLIPLTAALVMKVSFSLKGKAAAKPVGEAPSLKRSAAFAGLDDDEPVDAAPTAVGDKGKVAANKQFIAQSVEMSKSMKKKLEEEKRVDSTVFEYDEVWDKMQQAKLKQKEAKEAESKERKVSTLPPSCIVPVSCER